MQRPAVVLEHPSRRLLREVNVARLGERELSLIVRAAPPPPPPPPAVTRHRRKRAGASRLEEQENRAKTRSQQPRKRLRSADSAVRAQKR